MALETPHPLPSFLLNWDPMESEHLPLQVALLTMELAALTARLAALAEAIEKLAPGSMGPLPDTTEDDHGAGT